MFSKIDAIESLEKKASKSKIQYFSIASNFYALLNDEDLLAKIKKGKSKMQYIIVDGSYYYLRSEMGFTITTNDDIHQFKGKTIEVDDNNNESKLLDTIPKINKVWEKTYQATITQFQQVMVKNRKHLLRVFGDHG